MKSIYPGLALLGLIAFGTSAAQAQQFRESRCGNSTLRGTYAFNAQGFTLAGSPVPMPLQGPFASGGTAVYDGRGNVTLTASASFSGVIQSLGAIKGAYSVNPDCTFTSRLDNGVTFYAVIVDDGTELYVLQTTPGVVASGTAVRQTPSRSLGLDHFFGGCNAGIYRGTYGFISTGFAGPPTVPSPAAGPLAGVGTVSFDPNGTFKLTAVRSANGIIDPQPLALTGTFTTGPDCTFKMVFEVGFHFDAVIADGGQEITFFETDPGTTFVVKAKKM
jgi:hypothetical protein